MSIFVITQLHKTELQLLYTVNTISGIDSKTIRCCNLRIKLYQWTRILTEISRLSGNWFDGHRGGKLCGDDR